jgi:HlyD family secretion protein
MGKAGELNNRATMRIPSLIIIAILSLCVGCKKPAVVSVTSIAKGEVEAVVVGVNSGTVEAEQVAELAFGAVGRVKDVSVALGERVVAGSILAEIENDDLRSQLDVAEEELARAKRLAQSRAASRSTVIQAQGVFDAARIAYEKSLIKAPFDGIIVERNLEVGQLSQITAVVPVPALRIVDTKPRYITVEIDEVDSSKIALGQNARIKILAVRREPFTGSVRKVIPFVSSVREQDRTTAVELDIESEGILLPVGASADVEIIIERKRGVLVAPSQAVLGRGGTRHVYRVVDDTLSKSEVQVGISGYSSTEILSGLREGDTIALPSDKFELKDQMVVDTQE